MKRFYFLWLNETNLYRHYWAKPAQGWTTTFCDATRFATRREAIAEAKRAERLTVAEVCIQEYRLDA